MQLADGGHRLDVPARLDLQLDAAVALVEVLGHPPARTPGSSVIPTDTPNIDRIPDTPEVLGQRDAGRPQLGVEHGDLEGLLGHAMALDRLEEVGHGGAGQVVPAAKSIGTRWSTSARRAPSLNSGE